MNEITMKMQADQLIRMALQEDITSEDVSTNRGYADSKQKEPVERIEKEDGVIAGRTFMREYLQSWMKKQRLIFIAKMEMK